MLKRPQMSWPLATSLTFLLFCLLLALLQSYWPLDNNQQAWCHLRDFALTVPLAWNDLLLDTQMATPSPPSGLCLNVYQ